MRLAEWSQDLLKVAGLVGWIDDPYYECCFRNPRRKQMALADGLEVLLTDEDERYYERRPWDYATMPWPD